VMCIASREGSFDNVGQNQSYFPEVIRWNQA